MTDSAHLFALWIDLLHGAATLSESADALVASVSKLSAELDQGAVLNLLLANADEAVVVRYATPGQSHASLCWRVLEQAVVVASEPLDADPGWREVTKNSRLSIRDGELVAERVLP